MLKNCYTGPVVNQGDLNIRSHRRCSEKISTKQNGRVTREVDHMKTLLRSPKFVPPVKTPKESDSEQYNIGVMNRPYSRLDLLHNEFQ